MATQASTLQKQLPEFVGSGDMFSEVFAIDADKLNQLATDRLDVFNQMFVETGTWGLKFWEVFLGIAVDETLPVNLRRANIKSKIQAARTFTVERLKGLFEAFGYTVVELIEDNFQYQIQIRTANAPKNYQELMLLAKALQVVYPAHLDLVIVSEESVEKKVVDIEELGWALVTPDERFLYILGESTTVSSDWHNQLSKVYKYDANTLEKISVIDYGLTYNATTTPGYKMYKPNSAMSDSTIFIHCTERIASTHPDYKITPSIDRLATINVETGALIVNNLHQILGEPMTYVGTSGVTLYNGLNNLRVHYDTNDNYLYLIYCVGDFSYDYEKDIDTRQWYVARLDPITLTVISKTLIPHTQHVTKYGFVDTTVSYPRSEKTTWYSECYGSNVQIIRGIDGDYAVFFDREIEHRVISSQAPPSTSPTITIYDGLKRMNPLVQIMSLSSLRLSTVKTPEVNKYAKRFGYTGGATIDGWWGYYKDVKTNLSRYFGLPIHFPDILTESSSEEGRVGNATYPEIEYGLISIDPVSHEVIAKYDVPGSSMTTGYTNGIYNVPKNTTEDMSLWMHTCLDPVNSYDPYFKYGVTQPLYPDGKPFIWRAYHDIKFGALRYPFTKYDSGGVQCWNEEVVTGIQWFDASGNQNGGSSAGLKQSRLYTAQNNSNLVFYMFDTRNFGDTHYDSSLNANAQLSNLPAMYGRKLVRTPERLYNKFRLWSLLGY